MGLARTLYVHHIFGAFPAKTIVYTPYIHRVGQIRIRIIIRIIRYGIYAIFSSLPPLYLNFVFPYIRLILAVFIWAILSHNRFGVGWSQ